MEKIIKISSQQGFAGVWQNTATAPSNLNLVDFVIPSGLNVDLSRSYMSFNSQINNGTNDTPINARWKLNVDNANDYNVPTAALIKNAHIRNDRGMVESLRKVDSLACGLWGLTNSAETRKNDLNTFAKYVDGRGIGNYTSYQLDCVTDNTAPDGSTVNAQHVSKNLSRDIKIPLKDVFGIGGAEKYSTNNFGETRIHCETNFSLLKSEHLGGAEDTSNMFDGATKFGAMVGKNNIADGDSYGTDMVSSGAYGDWQFVSPFFQGQQVELSYDVVPSAGGAAVPTTLTSTIVSIKYQTNNTLLATGATPNTNFSKVIITLANDVYSNASGVAQDIENLLVKYDKNALDLQNVINRAELCLYTIPDDGDMPNSLTFPTYSTEEDNGNGLTSLSRQYMIEPEADAFLIACCNNNTVLPNRSLSSYRYAIDQDEQTGNRDIDVCSDTKLGSPLQYDRLQRCLDSQIAVGFRNAQIRFYKNDETNQDNVYGSPISMICETLDETQDSKMLNINIETAVGGGAGVQKMVIYKHMYKTI